MRRFDSLVETMPVVRVKPATSRWRFVALALLLTVTVLLAWWGLKSRTTGALPTTLHAESAAVAVAVVVVPARVPVPAPASPHASRVAPAPNPQDTPSPLNFDSVDDMYALAVRAANSTDPLANYNGAMALVACRVQDRSQLDAIAAGAVASPQDKERVRAAALVLHRCVGVFNNDESANLELLQRLVSVVRQAPGFFTGAGLLREPTLQDFQLAVKRGDWVTLHQIIVGRSIRLQLPEAAASQAVSEEALLAYSAGSLASCDFGRHCGPDGFEYASSCASGNGCQGSFEAFTRQDQTPAQWARIQALREQIVAAVRRRDAAYFGIKP